MAGKSRTSERTKQVFSQGQPLANLSLLIIQKFSELHPSAVRRPSKNARPDIPGEFQFSPQSRCEDDKAEGNRETAASSIGSGPWKKKNPGFRGGNSHILREAL